MHAWHLVMSTFLCVCVAFSEAHAYFYAIYSNISILQGLAVSTIDIYAADLEREYGIVAVGEPYEGQVCVWGWKQRLLQLRVEHRAAHIDKWACMPSPHMHTYPPLNAVNSR
jgi:hypothetical protein